jgi:septum formation protein
VPAQSEAAAGLGAIAIAIGRPRRKAVPTRLRIGDDLITSFRDRGDDANKRRVRITAARPLVLGSASPRRREMVAMIGVPAIVRAAHVDESQRTGEAPDAYLVRVAAAKLDAVRAGDLGDAAGVLVADTIVVAPDGGVLGKPADDDEACAMIERLGGATHAVSTRFLLAEPGPGAGVAHAQTVTTRVTFRALFPGEARAYASTGEGRDKAGAYAVQGRASVFVERLEGSYTSVVGLPLCELVVALRRLGWL